MKKNFYISLVCAACVLLGSANGLRASDLQRVIEGLPERGDGAFLRTYPDGFRLFGVGSAPIDDPDDAEAILRSERVATMNARKAINEYLSQTLSGETSVSQAFEEAESVSEAEGETTRTAQRMTKETFANEVSVGTEAIMKGVVTIKTIQMTKETHTISRVLVGFSSRTLNVLDNVVASGAGKGIVPAGGDVMPDEEKAEEWLLCIGHGSNRKQAIQAAIIEGVQQVYGVYLESNETYKERFAKLKAKTDGETVSAQSSAKEGSQQVLTETKGFVDSYRIISVEPIDSGMEAKIKAKFVNPRAGGLKAIMVYPMQMPLSKQTNVYAIAPKKHIGGKELAGICARRLEKAFTKDNKYLVLNIDDMMQAVQQQKLTKALVEADAASPAELVKAGKLLTADYILNTTFGDFVYSRKLGMNKTTKKMEPVERVLFSFEYSILEVKTGERRKQDILSVVLNNEVIAALRHEDEEATDDEMATKIFEQAMLVAVKKLAEEVKF